MNRAPRISVALVSGTALAYEVLLMRLFSIVQWHHFAFMIISLALLGYGVSGTFLTLARQALLSRFAAAYLTNLALFGVASVACYLGAQAVPFNPLEMLWEPQQLLWLACVYLTLALPFFFAANAIGLAFMAHARVVPRLYAADLLGAGLGGLVVIGLLFVVFPITALQALTLLGLLGAAVAWLELRTGNRAIALTFVVAGTCVFALPEGWTDLTISPYKSLNQTLRVHGTQIIAERSSPLGLIHVVESPQVPLRHAPGLSLNATTEPPEQLGLFTDADAMSAITRYPDDRSRLAYLDQMTSALPYHLAQIDRALVLGAGGGSAVLQAHYEGVEHIDAVELNPQVAALVSDTYRAFAGRLFQRRGIDLHVAEARGYLARTERTYDLIELAVLGGGGALPGLQATHGYTVEAFSEYLQALRPGGWLSVTRSIDLPPRAMLKLFATAVRALERNGVGDPGRHLALIRGWRTATLVVREAPLTSRQIDGLERFCESRSFDVAWHPDLTRDQANRFNVLSQPYFFEGARALLGDGRDRFIEQYKFALTPATDDRPYFFHYFKWGALPELLALRGQGGTALLEMGYLILIATLAQAVVASIVLIVLPLPLGRARPGGGTSRVRPLTYFFALGLAFLFVEIAFIETFTRFLHHPLYAVAVVLTGFLLFAGMGSVSAQRLSDSGRQRQGVLIAITGIAAFALAYVLILPHLFDALAGLTAPVRVAIALALLAPLAFFMGMPFPLGLSRLSETAPLLVPWAWGINGCASVISAVLATLLAIHLGFSGVVVLAILLYAVAGASFTPGWAKRTE